MQDQAPLPERVWNRIPDTVRDRLITLAMNGPELSPRELAVTFTDTKGYFVCESSVYRLRQGPRSDHQPRFNRGHQGRQRISQFETHLAINQQWQTDFTCLKIIG